jgi:ParB family transcriptional regulator, chromosome partitioning protein
MSRVVSSTGSLLGVIDDIDITKIRHPKKQLRTSSYNVTELASSIKRNGLLQPIIVRMVRDHYEIVAGNRRYEACKSLGWRKVTCHIEELDDREAFEISLVENIQRRTLNPVEEAKAFKAYVSDLGWGGVTELASKLGKSVSFVTKRIGLLRLPPEVLESINESALSTSVAEELSSLKDNNKQTELAKIISERHLTLRRVRQLIEGIDDREERNTLTLDCNIDNNVEAPGHQIRKSIDKSIIVLKIALNKIDAVINDSRDHSWLIQEILLHHRHILHDQIDILLKEKKKTEHRLITLLK